MRYTCISGSDAARTERVRARRLLTRGICAFALVGSTLAIVDSGPAVALSNTVLILDRTVSGGASSLEAQAAIALGFSVDTHLFRELGELLVGRDSTALVVLIKNAYDADATDITVHGTGLAEQNRGTIVITDTGLGMTEEQFRRGFLRIAAIVAL